MVTGVEKKTTNKKQTQCWLTSFYIQYCKLTFGPMTPGGPISPLCPEHLHGTPQHPFSAMLSCVKGIK